MAQCEGRSQRTGERCRRSAVGGATTCSYHDPGRRRPSEPAAPRPRARPTFTTRPLSTKTFGDFETLFAAGTGWGRCACLFALDARRTTNGGTWAAQRETNLRTMRGLVEHGRSQGILVYDGRIPVGWCQFVAGDRLRFPDVAASGPDWFVTCFVVDPRYRGLGATSVALQSAVEEIGRRGGGLVEGRATAMVPGPAPTATRKEAFVEDDVLYLDGRARVRYGVQVDGVGPVAALYRSRRSMHGAPLGGTVDLFRRVGFEALGVVPPGPSGLADRVIMRRDA